MAVTPADPGPATPRPRVCTVESLRLADGRTICARRWLGSGTTPLVVLHGLLDSSESWGRLYEQLGCGGVAVDLPGFGYSEGVTPGSVAGFARDVVEALEMLGHERFTLVGHSLGGAVATAVAEQIPERVAALVLLAPAGFGRIQLAEAVSVPLVRTVVAAALPLALRNRAAVTAGYAAMVANGRAPQRDLLDRVTGRGGALAAGAREGTRAVVDAGRSSDAFHRRRCGYAGPVFALWGERDRLVPVSHRRGVQTAFPHARIDVWPGMGHHPLHERFEQLSAFVHAAAESAGRLPAAAPAMSDVA